MRTFRYSIVYLFALFLALVLDQAVSMLADRHGDGRATEDCAPAARQEHRVAAGPARRWWCCST